MFIISGFLVSVIALYVYIFLVNEAPQLDKMKVTLCLGPLLSSLCVTYTASTPGLSLLVQVASWTLFLGSTPAALTTKPFYLERTPFLCLALVTSYNLLSLSYEVAITN